MGRLKVVTPADRLAAEVARLRRELDIVLHEYLAATTEPDERGPVKRVVDPLAKRSE